RLDRGDAGNSSYLRDGRVIERAFRCLLRLVRPALSFPPGAGPAGSPVHSRLYQVRDALAVNRNLVEEVQLFEAGDRVALQAQSERDHRDDDGDADDDAHRRQARAQLRLAQIARREAENVA